MKYLITISMLILCSLTAFGQNTFSLELAPVSLPGNHQTVAGTAAGADFTVTPNFDLGNFDVVAPGQNFQYFSGHFNYRFPQLSNYLNNHTNLNFLKLRFGATGSVGIDRITTVGRQHFGETVGGYVEYLTGGGKYSIGVNAQYAKFPGLNNNTAIVSLDPAIHF